MTGLVEQLQRAIIDDKIQLSNILLQIKLAASKLALDSVEEWVQKEISGYSSGVGLPEYRQIMGTPTAFNPYRGPMPIQGPAEFIKTVSLIKIRQPINEIERILDHADKGMISFTYPPGPREALRNMLNFPFEVHNDVSASSLYGILAFVRNIALDWSTELDKKGVVGKNFSFTTAEKKSADTIINNNFGSFVGVFGNKNTVRDISVSDRNRFTNLNKIIDETNRYKKDLVDSGVSQAEIDQVISSAKQAQASGGKDVGKTQAVLQSFLEAFAKAEGSVVAAGLTQLVHQAMAMFG